MSFEAMLPVIFLGLMGLAMLLYVILDGYDLGVGILMNRVDDPEKDIMLSSIGPFWDANETWLVLGVGILLIAFPIAHGVILGALYLPVTLMLFGLILRGVAFDFRIKVHVAHKPWWNSAFYIGSLIASFSQGVMLGLYIVGFQYSLATVIFSLFTGLSLLAGYALLGAGWLIMKTTGDLQTRAVFWARRSLWLTALGVAAISITTPLVSARIFEKWFSLPNLFLLAPIPLITALLFVIIDRFLKEFSERFCWIPFTGTVFIFILSFFGLAYSLFPYLVMDKITIWEAASAPASLKVILIGVALVFPMIVGYTIFSYRVFWGKTRELTYH